VTGINFVNLTSILGAAQNPKLHSKLSKTLSGKSAFMRHFSCPFTKKLYGCKKAVFCCLLACTNVAAGAASKF
jgi:hypothetical protein